jgi:hypothetical protein
MVATNLGENSNGKRKHLRLLTILLLTAATVFFTMGETALAKKKKKNRRNQYCTQTAQVVYKACLNEIADDYWIANANCINLEDPDAREECFDDATKGEEGYKQAIRECKVQYKARLDVCDDVGEGRYDPTIDPSQFVNFEVVVDGDGDFTPNPYFPLVPGNRWTYKTYEEDDRDNPTETTVVEVTDETIMIEGVWCIVVRDTVYEGDSTENIIEETDDWYGQQTDGTVWYFGEWSLSQIDCDPEELCEGLLSEEGSWKSGWDGAKAGIIMFGDPSAVDPGTTYRQEVSWGNAEDVAELVRFNMDSVEVPLNGGTTYDANVLQNREFSPLEPDVEEFKYYAPGVGVVLEENRDDDVRVELVEFEEG